MTPGFTGTNLSGIIWHCCDASFHVVDFSPSNKGVQLLLQPFNPSAVDIKIELLESNDIVYTKTQEDVIPHLKY